MSNPEDSLNGIIDKFTESETLLLAIKTPERAVIERLIRAAMMDSDNEFGLEITGLHFDSAPIRQADADAIVDALEKLQALNIKRDPNSLQIT